MQPPKQLFAFIWHFLKNDKLSLSIIMMTACVWAAELSLSPYFFKLIIDGVSLQASHPERLLSVILLPAILYCSMSLLLNFFI